MMKLWTAILKCNDCSKVLNRAVNVPEGEKSQVNVSSALAAGSCPNGCSPSASDYNINTILEWQKEE